MTGEAEAFSAASGILVGIGTLLLLGVFAWFFYQFSRLLKFTADKEQKYELLEEMSIDKMAKRKGIDLERELVKRDITKKRTFRKEVEKSVIEELFGKEKD